MTRRGLSSPSGSPLAHRPESVLHCVKQGCVAVGLCLSCMTGPAVRCVDSSLRRADCIRHTWLSKPLNRLIRLSGGKHCWKCHVSLGRHFSVAPLPGWLKRWETAQGEGPKAHMLLMKSIWCLARGRHILACVRLPVLLMPWSSCSVLRMFVFFPA